MSERSRPSSAADGSPSSRRPGLTCRCVFVLATLGVVVVPLLIVGAGAWSAGATGLGWPLIASSIGAAVAAALSSAVAARWCAEQRMRNDVAQHERELAHTKRQILALVSHELRTPVTGVVGFSRTLSGRLDDLDHDTLRLFVDAIDEHSNRLARLIDNVIVASRTPLVVLGGSCQLSLALSKAIARVGVDPEASPLRISLEGSLDACIDEEAAIRILANLIDNAIKFGEPDTSIYLDGNVRDGYVIVRIANAGPAISLNLRSVLYEPFMQGDTTDTRTADGLGLGLHVCRQLVEAYAGTIDLVDHPRLTVFEIKLPAAARSATEGRRVADEQPDRAAWTNGDRARPTRSPSVRPRSPAPAAQDRERVGPRRERVG